MTTEAGCRRALARVARLEEALAVMQAELANLDIAIETGYLAPVAYFICSRRNPSLADELAALQARWSPTSSHAPAHFLETLRRECAGEI